MREHAFSRNRLIEFFKTIETDWLPTIGNQVLLDRTGYSPPMLPEFRPCRSMRTNKRGKPNAEPTDVPLLIFAVYCLVIVGVHRVEQRVCEAECIRVYVEEVKRVLNFL
jgi:hypothetical protein